MTKHQAPARSWVVLMSRVPRGPYSADEISRFLDQGLLRATDLAYLTNDDPKAPHEWHFIWQFPEFERRKSPSGDATQPGQTPRQALSTEQIKGRILSALPKELIDASREEIDRRIEPEPLTVIPPVEKLKNGLEPEREDTVESHFEWPGLRSFYMPLVVLSLAAVVFLVWHVTRAKHGVRELATPANTPPAEEVTRAPIPSRAAVNPSGNPPGARQGMMPSAPLAPIVNAPPSSDSGSAGELLRENANESQRDDVHVETYPVENPAQENPPENEPANEPATNDSGNDSGNGN